VNSKMPRREGSILIADHSFATIVLFFLSLMKYNLILNYTFSLYIHYTLTNINYLFSNYTVKKFLAEWH